MCTIFYTGSEMGQDLELPSYRTLGNPQNYYASILACSPIHSGLRYYSIQSNRIPHRLKEGTPAEWMFQFHLQYMPQSTAYTAWQLQRRTSPTSGSQNMGWREEGIARADTYHK